MGIFGMIFVIGMVLGGYVLHGGKIHVLIQPTEVMIIGGAAVGGMFIMAPMATVTTGIKLSIKALTSSGIKKETYIELLQMLFQLFQTFRKEGPQAVEAHVENPNNSEIFKKSSYFLKNHHAVHYLCDTLKVTLSADISQYDLEDLLTEDLKAIHEEEHAAHHVIATTSEAFPGLGIVAAVLGVVITMGKLDQGAQAIGNSVAAALVGTFLGVLLSYGFVGPIAGKIAVDIEDEGRYLTAIKAALVANQRGAPPLVCVDFARRSMPPHVRPSFEEMDAAVKG
ncbi:MAG: flagellar motor stator protein MotA [Bdellovibrionota bacterium]|nr:flagellar motor stator protein MotA [Pseudobdellovibrionaceae bacterium]|tara:strand:+ start:53581 stop:54426 length:846 start_codon:yes stop_codon:yes gene_type:complete